ncbi:hypothetical protein [Halobacterium yunchengense]|uniref:hypothetical protein n=1 Tax=Halobacterium yunchengense TaxID=3108497 RepID=UPI00300B2E13
MHTYAKALVSLAVGLLGLVAVGVAVTALLDPYVWPSLLLGAPAGVVAGVALVPLTYFGLTYWSERRATGSASVRTTRRLWTTVAGVLGFVAGGALATAVLWTQAVGLASAMLLAGLPVGVLASALAAVLAFRRDWSRRSPPGPHAE